MLKWAEIAIWKANLGLVQHPNTTVNEAVFETRIILRSVTAEAVIILKYLCGKTSVKHDWFDDPESARSCLCFSAEYFSSLCLCMCASWGFGAWVFPLHAWLCHRIFISPHTGRSSPLLLGVWHHFLLDGSIYHPVQEPPLSSVFRGRLFTHQWILMPLCSLEM